MEPGVRGIVLAGGWGVYDGDPADCPASRLLERIEGEAIISRTIRNVRNAGFHSPVVVINNTHHHTLAAHIAEHHRECTLVLQPQVNGQVVALWRAHEYWLDPPVTHVLVVFADMPFLSHLLLKTVLEEARQSQAAITLGVLNPHTVAPWLKERMSAWGRVVEEDGNVAIYHPGEGRDELFEPDSMVPISPSLWVFTRAALKELIPLVNTTYKGERILAHLPALAAKAGGFTVKTVPIERPEQALGINSREDLALAGQLLQEMMSTV